MEILANRKTSVSKADEGISFTRSCFAFFPSICELHEFQGDFEFALLFLALRMMQKLGPVPDPISRPSQVKEVSVKF